MKSVIPRSSTTYPVMAPRACTLAYTVLLILVRTRAAEPEATEKFKCLLSSPPIVQEMVYLDKISPRTHPTAQLEAESGASSNYVKYFLTWQPNAISFHSAPKVSSTDSHSYYDEYFLAWDDDYYFLNGPQFAFRYKREPVASHAGLIPAAYHAALIKQHAACEPMNLGINHLMPGSAVWDGDTFTALGSADQKPMFISGCISGRSNDVPTEMRVRYSNDMGVATYRIAYEYGPYRSPYYPTRITTYFQRNSTEKEYREYRILSVETANAPLPRGAFDVSSYVTSHSTPLRLLTNNSIYIQLPSGRLIETPGATLKQHLTANDYYSNRYYYLAIAITSSVFLLYAIKQSNQIDTKV